MHQFLLFLNRSSRETLLVGVLVEIVFIIFNMHLVDNGKLDGLESVN